ncbi:MAG TPA: cytochrome d ubiquinol oxidase subunit II, partial [Candidatus Saccharimonadales bacterium]|nr:cytochrome d ubiquinol oxidase subunit II [Candidatus Saccharimonadales bacterium]
VATGLLTLLLTAATLAIQPLVGRNLAAKPWGWLLPLGAVAGWAGARWFLARRRPLRAFLSSCLYLAGMLGSAAFGIYPYVLPSVGDPALGLTAAGTAAPAHGLMLALAWWIPGMLLVAGYFAFTYRRLAGKVETDGEGY